MGTEILKSFTNLQSELEQAKTSLKGVDENIKRLIGRDPSEPPLRPGVKRGLQTDDKPRQRIVKLRNFSHENDEPPIKRFSSNVSVFKRLSDRPVLESGPQKQMISKVIVTPKEVPSRQEALAAQSKDEKFKARNKRMFGALLGTLQKFQQEETKLKPKEEKRAQLEKKIEEHEIKEKQEIKKERQELFMNRRKKQAEIKVIELKMIRMKDYAYWEERQKPRANFLTTKAKPHIQFLPRRLNDTTKSQLEANKANIEKLIENKKNDVLEELKQIEERMKKNFENKSGKGKEEAEEHAHSFENENNHDNIATEDHFTEEKGFTNMDTEVIVKSDIDENVQTKEDTSTISIVAEVNSAKVEDTSTTNEENVSNDLTGSEEKMSENSVLQSEETTKPCDSEVV